MGLKKTFGQIKSGLTVYSRHQNWLIKTLAVAAVAAVPAGAGLALANSSSQPQPNSKPDHLESASMGESQSGADKSISSSSVHQQTTVSSTASSSSNSAEVTVNGKKVQVPENGSVDKSFEENGATTHVHLDHQSGAGGGDSSLNVSVESNSSTGK